MEGCIGGYSPVVYGWVYRGVFPCSVWRDIYRGYSSIVFERVFDFSIRIFLFISK